MDASPPVLHPDNARQINVRNLKLILGAIGLAVAAMAIVGGALLLYLHFTLPKLTKLTDYSPSLVTEIYSRDGTKYAEYSNERRFLTAYEEIPESVVHAFVASEDSNFFEHEGIDYRGIGRAFFKNLRAGHVVQGGSTITQQVAKSLLLTSERSFKRKLKEIVLARRIEKNLTKEEILYLYLNQIYLGHGAYGLLAASETYFHKPVKDLNLAEGAFLGGLPQAPSRYSPFRSRDAAKERQLYVLNRMEEEGYITPEEHAKARETPLKIYHRDDLAEVSSASDFAEYVRRYVQEKYGSEPLYAGGLKVYTTLDLPKQKAAVLAVRQGLEDLDKRQGYRGPFGHLELTDQAAVQEFLDAVHRDAVEPDFVIIPGASELKKNPQAGLEIPTETPLSVGKRYKALVTDFDKQGNFLTVKVGTQEGRLMLEDMKWARFPDLENPFDENAYYVKDARKRFKAGDEILVSLKTLSADEKKGKKYDKTLTYFLLEQDPIVQGSLLSMNPHDGAVLAMVGGYDFHASEFNRAVQGLRQPGSSFKPIIYAAALDKGYTPSSIIVDSPIVYESESLKEEEVKWRPKNYGDKFSGDTTFRKGLVKSMNVITIKILQDIGVEYVSSYARKLGITSPLNHDLSIALGSSEVSLLELTNVFGVFARGGRKNTPVFITKIEDRDGKELEKNPFPNLTPSKEPLVETQEYKPNDKEKEILYKNVPEGYLITPQTAYLITQLLSDVVQYGTGQRVKALGRPTAGKTGTTNEEGDTWFIGFTPDILTGVWVGYDLKKPLGKGENGGRTSSPIWLGYMKEATKNLPVRSFDVPPNIVFATVNRDSGLLAKADTPEELRVRCAYLEGTQPTTSDSLRSSVPEDQYYLIDSHNASEPED